MRATHETEAFCCSIAGRGHIVPASRLTLLLRSYQKSRCAGTCAIIVMQAYTDRQAQQVDRGFALSQDCKGCEYPHAQVAVVGRNRVRIMGMYIILEVGCCLENHIPPVNRQPQDWCRSERVAVMRASVCATVSRCRWRDWMGEDRL